MGDGFAKTQVLSTRAFHLAVLCAGVLFLLSDAFHGNVWFDESYSVALANHSFSEIWRIGSGDVHPVLFYWALHALNLVFGQNVLVYRLFTVAGTVALAVLGYSHVRRDFGWRAGVLFSFLALFTPYVAIMASEIRMYSWAAFTVMLCCIYAWRIFSRVRQGSGVPAGWWAVLFVSSLASAYLHYFGLLSAFMVNVLLLADLTALVMRRRASKRILAVFFVGAVAQVALYAPWLVVLAGQVGVVSDTYWANIVFPTTFIELATYPVMTSQVSFAARGAYGVGWQVALYAIGIVALVVLTVAVVRVVRWMVRRVQRARQDGGSGGSQGALRRLGCWLTSDRVLPVLAAFLVYGGVYVIALVASYLMDSLILYYRYLFVAIGPLLFGCALLLSRVRSHALVVSMSAVLLAVSVVNQCLVVGDDYAPSNCEPIAAFQKTVDELASEEGGDTPLVLSTDIGFMGVALVEVPEVPQTYMDWQEGNWDLAYEAYAPALSSRKSWELILDDFQGQFIVLGQSSNGEKPKDIADLEQKRGVTLISSQTFYRPYERTWFTIAVMQKDAAVPLAPR